MSNPNPNVPECNPMANTQLGLKYDADKLKWSLLRVGCTRALQGVIRVLMFGAKKYKAHSWKTVPNGEERYRDALERHLSEIDLHGPYSTDEESGELHWHHIACNALFLAELHSNPRVIFVRRE